MPKKTKTIIITGTHIAPAMELINQLKSDPATDWTIHYIGRQYTSPIDKIPAVEYELIPKMGVIYHIIDCGKLDRRYWPNTVQGLPKTIKGIFQAIHFVWQIHPNFTVSFGGYLSVPVILASKIFGVPSITHEQTFTNSLSTRLNSLFATKVALSFDNPKQIHQLPASKVTVTGNLLRSDLLQNQSALFEPLFSRTRKPLLYITAGNQGSHKINQQILALLPDLLKQFVVIHQTGKLEIEEIKAHTSGISDYFPIDYVTGKDIGWVFHHLDTIVSRAGANTIQDIAAFGLKSVIIPLPITQQDEQKINAKWLKSQQPHRTIILDDLKLTPRKLFKAIIKLNHDKKDYSINTKLTPNYRLLNLIHETC